jgi:hypothetical protein
MASPLDKDVVAEARKVFRKKKVLTLEELAQRLKCARPTARNRLKEWNVYTSYNQNARYYALPEVPEFDDKGIWVYQRIRFSKHGNLRQTLIRMVTDSDAGLDGNQIEQLIGLRAKSFLSLFRDTPELRREKHQGRYVYFSVDERIYARQREQRVRLIREAKMPSEMEAISILAEMIKHPDWDIDRIAARVKKQHDAITAQMIQNLLDTHDLGAPKKGPHSP